MDEKIDIGILGATGIVGQRLILMLADHPWFTLRALTASAESAGDVYGNVCTWRMETHMPEYVRQMRVLPTSPDIPCTVVFSAMSSSAARASEEAFARAGYGVISNAGAYRMEEDVPLIIPEVNPDHLEILERQKAARGFERGFIVTNPNCSAIPLALALAPLKERWGVSEVFVSTMQALSGAGYPGHASLDMLDNVIPYIQGEEEKIETETLKILGYCTRGSLVPYDMTVSAQAHRVAVTDGHTLSVSLKLRTPAPLDEIRSALAEFTGMPQEYALPSAPGKPIIIRNEEDRPQPRMDRHAGGGMAVTAGRIRRCPLFDVKMTLVSHNTIRGAAGAALLNAELLNVLGYL